MAAKRTTTQEKNDQAYAAKQIGAGAVAGATIGSVVPVVGTGLGAAAGAGFGMVAAGATYASRDRSKYGPGGHFQVPKGQPNPTSRQAWEKAAREAPGAMSAARAQALKPGRPVYQAGSGGGNLPGVPFGIDTAIAPFGTSYAPEPGSEAAGGGAQAPAPIDPTALYNRLAQGTGATTERYTRSPELQQGYNAVTRDVNAAKGQVQAQAAADRKDIMSRYNLAETKDEKLYLQWQLAELDAQTKAATKSIDASYNKSYTEGMGLAADARKLSKGDTERIQETWYDAAKAIGADNAAITGRAGGAMGLGLGTLGISGAGADVARQLATSGATQSVLATQLNDISAQNLTQLSLALRGEQGAQQGQLQRAQAANRNNAVTANRDRVEARIAREKSEMNGALNGVLSQRAQDLLGLGREGRGYTADFYGQEAKRRDGVTERNFTSKEQERRDRRSTAEKVALTAWENSMKEPKKPEGTPFQNIDNTGFGQTLSILEEAITSGKRPPVKVKGKPEDGGKVTEYEFEAGPLVGGVRSTSETIAGLPRDVAERAARDYYSELSPEQLQALRQLGLPAGPAELVNKVKGPKGGKK